MGSAPLPVAGDLHRGGARPLRGGEDRFGLMLQTRCGQPNVAPDNASSVESFWHKQFCAKTAFKRMKYYQLSWGE
jgi:hypothetical protein